VVDAVLARQLQSPSLVVGTLAAVAARARDWATLGPGDEPWPRHPRAGGPPWVLPEDHPDQP
jgi:ADP-ribose pyrophosphatase